MKRIGIFFLFALIILSACKKNGAPAPNSNSQLVLGYALDYQPFTSHMYLITNDGLYVDSTASSVTSFSFTSAIPNSAKYQLALPLLNNIPSYLANGAGGYINDSASPVGIGALHLEYTRNGHTVKWNIPPDTTYWQANIPTDVRDYVQQINTTFSQL